ncbi:MAG TPA: isoleucine--tRNA ligase [Rhabdochlamydiaceae bacterium]|nr:isoleucine--tRNA ligase [Rhabdochlamydiaceae bacterium]
MFETYSDETFPVREERILSFWQNEEIFQQSLKSRENGPFFSFYDGPPFATGLPHYGHLLAGTIKDVVPRYKTMKGFYVPRRFGWDCHGLPVEMEIEKAKALSGAPEIEAFGIGKFNEECRAIVLRYTEEWKKTVNRMGRWVDFEKTYRTMDFSFMESLWWVFYELYAKGLVYEGFKVMPFSAKLGTPISNFEANLNYKEVEDPSLTVIFPLRSEPETALLAWTTTPWTLPSNLALAVGPQIDYVKIKEHKTGRQYILAEARLPVYFKNPEEFTVIEAFKGKVLAGKHYEPLFPYFESKKDPNAFKVIADDWVSIEDGTGVVHMAPAFGEADFFTCTREGIELVCPVDHNGKFTREVPDFEGLYVKDADKGIIKHLKEKKRVFHHGQIRHRYPFCWRSDTPLIYKAVRTWFVAVEKIKDQIIQSNQEIHWVPEHIKEGRFGKWLENARDWAISRNRYWGTPIPIWMSSDGDIIVIGSVKELEKRTGKKIEDLHRHFIDDLTFEEGGKTFKRIPEVFDCWFESGSMPYAQNHYPFENEKETMENFPADFIAEGIDQTRCWFYTLTVISSALFQKPAFKNVIVNGIVLAEDGAKMSKRLKNYPEPERVMNEYGVDALRLFFLSSPAMVAEDMKFSEAGVELVLRQVLIPFWNSYVFLSTYARIYNWDPNSSSFKKPKADIDRWILSLLQKLIDKVTNAMDSYELNGAVEPFIGFIDQLTNWYIRRNRSRFWSEEDSPDRREAFETLYTVLFRLSQIAAPFIPFLTEAIFLQLKKKGDPESVHLCNYPEYEKQIRDEELEEEMGSVQLVVTAGHALRKENKLKVRQPLTKAHVITADEKKLSALKGQKQLICDELNVKEIQFSSNEEDFVALSIKPNFRVLGKKVGPLMGKLQQLISSFNQKQIGTLLSGKNLELSCEGQTVTLTPEDVAIERKVLEGLIAKESEGVTVALDTALTEELLTEGLAREIVNKINTMRRENGYAVTDRINVKMDTTERAKEAFHQHKEYICHEVLALSVVFQKCEGTPWDLNGEPTLISIEAVF